MGLMSNWPPLILASLWMLGNCQYNVYRQDPFAILSRTLLTYQHAACDGQVLNLVCPAGTKISIQLVQYGRTAPSSQVSQNFMQWSWPTSFLFWPLCLPHPKNFGSQGHKPMLLHPSPSSCDTIFVHFHRIFKLSLPHSGLFCCFPEHLIIVTF